jgi:hypothetical protein
MLKYKVPVGAPGDCKHCDKPLTYQGEHKDLGSIWTHDHNRTVWCETGANAKNLHSAEPKF